MDSDGDGGVTLADFNAATKACQRAEAGLFGAHAKEKKLQRQLTGVGRDSSPRKQTNHRK